MREVKVLCNLEDLDYDTNTKTYSFNSTAFDIEQPVSVEISCNVVLPSKKPYIFLCSDEIHSRQRVRQNSTKFGPSICVLDSKNVFEYTEVPQQQSSSSQNTGTAPSVDDVTDADIEAFGGDLRVWFDHHPSRVLTTNFSQCSAVGDLCSYIYARSPAPAALVLSGGGNLEVYQWKAGVQGLSGVLSAGGDILGMKEDISYPTTVYGQEFHFHHIFKTHSDYDEKGGLFTLGQIHTGLRLEEDGGFNAYTLPSSTTFNNFVWLPNRTYIISFMRKLVTDNDGDGVLDPEMQWRLEDVEAGTVVTETTGVGTPYTGTSDGNRVAIGFVGRKVRHIFGPTLLVNGTNQVQYDTSINWLKNWFGLSSSGNSNSSSSQSSSSTTHYAYNLEKNENIFFKHNCQTVNNVDFSFRDQTGALMEPTRGIVKLTFMV